MAQRTRRSARTAHQGSVLLEHIHAKFSFLSRVGAQTGLGGETFAADGAVERPVFGPLHLGIVVAEMLLQIGQLYESSSALGQVASVRSFSCMQSGVLLDVAELFEPALAVGTLVRLLAGVDANVLDQLVVGAERLETLLALVWFAHFQAAAT